MAGHSIPVDFRVNPTTLANDNDRNKLMNTLTSLIGEYLDEDKLSLVSSVALPNNDYQLIYANKNGVTLAVKIYKNGLVSSTIEFYTDNIHSNVLIDSSIATLEAALDMESKIKTCCQASMAKVLPAIKRGPPINLYYTTSDDRLLEYDVTKMVFSEKSPFQQVDIVETKSFGNMLVLDNLQNLAESDLEYTHGVMNKGVDGYKDKTILILGGGDGALLKELLVEKPKFVTMIDIDEAVMRACKQHLRGACGDVLDNFKGENYEVIVGDALARVEDYIKEGKTFDYVISDLTDLPITNDPVDNKWNFMKVVMTLGLQVLVPKVGRMMTHVIGIQNEKVIVKFEELCRDISKDLVITRTNRYVPSFMENWVFFQFTRGEGAIKPLKNTGAPQS